MLLKSLSFISITVFTLVVFFFKGHPRKFVYFKFIFFGFEEDVELTNYFCLSIHNNILGQHGILVRYLSEYYFV